MLPAPFVPSNPTHFCGSSPSVIIPDTALSLPPTPGEPWPQEPLLAHGCPDLIRGCPASLGLLQVDASPSHTVSKGRSERLGFLDALLPALS